MTENKTKTRDFFMQLGLMVALYSGTIALLNILFRIINIAYPQVNSYYNVANISFPVATLIVVFPIFLILANIINKGYAKDPSRKELAIRNWLIYITLFIAGIVIAGDLITLLYFFLDGRELTTGFLLKVLSIVVVGGSIFGYFFDDLRNKLTSKRRNIWRIIAIVLVLGSIIGGFLVIGTPKKQRLMRYDEQSVMDLQNIQSQVINYWQIKGSLPVSLDALKDPLSSYDFFPVVDSVGRPYVYNVVDSMNFELCANFNFKLDGASAKSRAVYYGGPESENWQHDAGEYCFKRTIDPERYPKFKNF